MVKQRRQLCNLVLRDYGKFFEQRLSYALIPVLGSYVEVFKLYDAPEFALNLDGFRIITYV